VYLRNTEVLEVTWVLRGKQFDAGGGDGGFGFPVEEGCILYIVF